MDGKWLGNPQKRWVTYVQLSFFGGIFGGDQASMVPIFFKETMFWMERLKVTKKPLKKGSHSETITAQIMMLILKNLLLEVLLSPKENHLPTIDVRGYVSFREGTSSYQLAFPNVINFAPGIHQRRIRIGHFQRGKFLQIP